jgi:hypothetical protein
MRGKDPNKMPTILEGECELTENDHEKADKVAFPEISSR